MLKRLSGIFKGIDAYLVGPCVRDMISGTKPEKLEVVARCLPHKLVDLGAVSSSGPGEFPVFVLYDVEGDIQITLPRGAGTEFGVFHILINPYLSIYEDLAQKDFTINAIAINLHTGERIDPYAGFADLTCGVLRHVSDNFPENPLDVFKAYRQCTGGLSIEPETKARIKTVAIEDFAAVPDEKVYAELMKAMAGKHPARFYTEMVNTGIGLTAFGEVIFMNRIPAGPKEFYGDESIFEHSVKVLKKVAAMTPDPVARLAAFMHDTGKVCSPMDEWPHHYEHDMAGACIVESRLKALKAADRTIVAVSAVCALHMKAKDWDQMRPDAALKLAATARNCGVDKILPLVVRADTGREMKGWEVALEISDP